MKLTKPPPQDHRYSSGSFDAPKTPAPSVRAIYPPAPAVLSSSPEPTPSPSRHGSITLGGRSSPTITPCASPWPYPSTRASSITLTGSGLSPGHSPKVSTFNLVSEAAPESEVVPEPHPESPQPKESFCSAPLRILRSIRDAFARQISLRAIVDGLDPRDIFWPLSWRKYGTLLVICACVAGIVMSNYYFHWIEKAMDQTREFMLPVLIIVVGTEPIMSLLVLCIAQIPDIKDQRMPHEKFHEGLSDNCEEKEDQGSKISDDNTDIETGYSGTSTPVKSYRTALVLPCHKSDCHALKRLLESAYLHFRPQDIFIVDNGRSMQPLDPTFRAWVREQHPDIVYIWSPIGSKNASQLVGSLAARDYQYIMTVDDDVCIPSNFSTPEDMITDSVKAVAMPIKATDPHGRVSLFLVGWQDCEYRMAGLAKMAESRVCGVLFPHGAGWFIEREAFVTMLSHYHSMDFIADDVNCGIGFMKMHKQLSMDASVVLETEVPTTILGPGLNWWKQRYKSWEMGRHGLSVNFLGRLLLSFNGQRTIHGILFQKFILLYNILANVIDWIRVPVFVTMGPYAMFWLQAGLLTLFSTIPLLAYSYIKCRRRPDMRCSFWGSLTYPIYKQLYSFVSIFGLIRCVLFYIGGHRAPKTIQQMIEDNDERCIWLDPRFASNPGFLADVSSSDEDSSTDS